MNEIQIINKQEVLGKNFTVYGTFQSPLFLAKDVAEWIEHTNVSVMLQSIDEDEKGINNVYTLGGNQESWFLTEDGLYEVLMQSRKPIAKAFKKKVKEILKQLRTTGVALASDDDAMIAKAMEVLQLRIEYKQQQLEAAEHQNHVLEERNKVQENVIKANAPKIEYFEKVLESKGYLTVNVIAAELGISAIKLNKLLCEWGIQYYQSECYFLYSVFRDKGYTVHRPHYYAGDNGNVKTRQHMYWTEKGKKFIVELYNKKTAL